MKFGRVLLTSCIALIGCSSLNERQEPLAPELARKLSLDILQERKLHMQSREAELENVRSVFIDELGEAHTRVTQSYKGVPVFGSEVIVHLDKEGKLKDITSRVAKNIELDTQPSLTEKEAIEAAVKSVGGWVSLSTDPQASLQILRRDDGPKLTWQVQLETIDVDDPERPLVFIDAHTGEVVWSHDSMSHLKNREVHNLNHGTTLPGPVTRIENQAAVGDLEVDGQFDRLGATYDCYKALFNRDSYDNAGAKLVSSVRYASNFNTAKWDGVNRLLLFGEGNMVDTRGLAQSLDVTAHEFTHAVTQFSSGLMGDQEPGGLNESIGDIFGAVCEWNRANPTNLNAPTVPANWTMAEGVTLSSPVLRYLADPAKDGYSIDYYFTDVRWNEAHFLTGITNLAFYLLSEGGTHPRGKSSNVVTGIGINAAARIFYRANTVYLTPYSDFADARELTIRAAEDLYGVGSIQATQTGNAWTAVGLLPAPVYNKVVQTIPVTGQANIPAIYSFVSNGKTPLRFTLDTVFNDTLLQYPSQLYVRFGSAPTDDEYDCGFYRYADDNMCEFSPAKAGTYYMRVIPNSDVNAVPSGTLIVRRASEICGDSIDNNANGKIDCADVDCQGYPSCLPATETSCFDGVDNDGDGAIDCTDSNCKSTPACLPEKQCDDGVDNDSDGKTDCLDSNCSSAPICNNTLGWTLISNATFETALTPYAVGGVDAARVLNVTAAAAGSYSVQIRDNSGVPSSFSTATAMNLTNYSRMRIDYSYYALSLEKGESFVVEVLDGTSWVIVDRKVNGLLFSNNAHNTASTIVDLKTLSSRNALKIRFRADASADDDQIFLDNIKVQAK